MSTPDTGQLEAGGEPRHHCGEAADAVHARPAWAHRVEGRRSTAFRRHSARPTTSSRSRRAGRSRAVPRSGSSSTMPACPRRSRIRPSPAIRLPARLVQIRQRLLRRERAGRRLDLLPGQRRADRQGAFTIAVTVPAPLSRRRQRRAQVGPGDRHQEALRLGHAAADDDLARHRARQQVQRRSATARHGRHAGQRLLHGGNAAGGGRGHLARSRDDPVSSSGWSAAIRSTATAASWSTIRCSTTRSRPRRSRPSRSDAAGRRLRRARARASVVRQFGFGRSGGRTSGSPRAPPPISRCSGRTATIRPASTRRCTTIYDYVVAQNIGPAVVDAPEDLFSDRVYLRGAAALYALRQKVGDRTFFRILRTFQPSIADATPPPRTSSARRCSSAMTAPCAACCTPGSTKSRCRRCLARRQRRRGADRWHVRTSSGLRCGPARHRACDLRLRPRNAARAGSTVAVSDPAVM